MSDQAVLVVLTLVPLAATLASVVLPYRATVVVTVAAGAVSFVLTLALVPRVAHRTVEAGFLRADAVSLVFALATAFLYLTTAVYAVGYFADRARAAERDRHDPFRRYARTFAIGFNAFAWSMLCAPLVDGLALLWVAIEITTVVSALLVALDRTDRATEAAWKYVLIASSGLGIGLFATIMLYYAGSTVLGQSYDLAFEPLLQVADRLPAVPVELAFGLAVLGFGTKVGLFPVHTWLPDAHSEAPTPVSVLLSGGLLATSFYAIVRYYQVAHAALGPAYPQTMLLVFGVLSLLLAALYLFGQRDIKRMLAYSSVEHMGILAIALSLGAPVAIAGMLLHVLGHAAAKSTAFMGAGVFVHTYRTKELGRMRGALDRLPWTGPLFLLAILSLCALPPFGIFRSELQIVAGGLGAGHGFGAVALVVLVTLAFGGLTASTTRVLYDRPPRPDGVVVAGDVLAATGVVRREPSAWTVVPMVAGLAALLLLGVHPPADLVAMLDEGARQIAGVQP